MGLGGGFEMKTPWLVHAIAHSLLEAVLGMTATSHRKQCFPTAEAMFGGTASYNGGNHRERCFRTSEAFSRLVLAGTVPLPFWGENRKCVHCGDTSRVMLGPYQKNCVHADYNSPAIFR